MVIDADCHTSPTPEGANSILVGELLRRMDQPGVERALGALIGCRKVNCAWQASQWHWRNGMGCCLPDLKRAGHCACCRPHSLHTKLCGRMRPLWREMRSQPALIFPLRAAPCHRGIGLFGRKRKGCGRPDGEDFWRLSGKP